MLPKLMTLRFKVLIVGLVGAAAVCAGLIRDDSAQSGVHSHGNNRANSSRTATMLSDAFLLLAPAQRRIIIDHETTLESLLDDLTQRLQSIQEETNPARREEQVEWLTDSIDGEKMAAVLQFLNGKARQSELSHDLALRIIQRWTGNDPAAASRWAAGLTSAPEREDAIQAVAIAWASRDLDGTARWARQLPGDAERQRALISAAYEASRHAPVAALQLAADLPEGQPRNEMVLHAARQWAANDSKQALDWGQQIQDQTLRNQVLGAIITSWSETDPHAAADAAVSLLPPGRQQNDAVVGIVKRWKQQEPQLAAAWVAQFPKGSLRQTALESLNP